MLQVKAVIYHLLARIFYVVLRLVCIEGCVCNPNP